MLILCVASTDCRMYVWHFVGLWLKTLRYPDCNIFVNVVIHSSIFTALIVSHASRLGKLC